MRGEINCRRVALLFRHDSNRFFFNRALNCWNTNGKPVRVVLMVCAWPLSPQSLCVCQWVSLSQVGDERRRLEWKCLECGIYSDENVFPLSLLNTVGLGLFCNWSNIVNREGKRGFSFSVVILRGCKSRLRKPAFTFDTAMLPNLRLLPLSLLLIIFLNFFLVSKRWI